RAGHAGENCTPTPTPCRTTKPHPPPVGAVHDRDSVQPTQNWLPYRAHGALLQDHHTPVRAGHAGENYRTTHTPCRTTKPHPPPVGAVHDRDSVQPTQNWLPHRVHGALLQDHHTPVRAGHAGDQLQTASKQILYHGPFRFHY